MKTLEIVNKYQKIIGDLLKIDGKEIKFIINDKEVGEVFDLDKKDILVNHWTIGKFKVLYKKDIISTFELYQMPHCCGIVVSCKAYVFEEFRGKRVGTILNHLRQDIGRQLGYSMMLCTDIEQNTNQRKLLKTNGWRDIDQFINKRTKNRVYISSINL